MKLRRALLWLAFIDFSVFSLWAVWEVGFFGVWASGFSDIGSMQITLDLLLCAICICIWLKGDAESKQINPYPWIAAIVASGAVGVLGYLLFREYRVEHQQTMRMSPSL